MSLGPGGNSDLPIAREILAELALVALLELLAREAVILRAARFDLDGAEERGDASGRLPFVAMQQAMNYASTICIATAGRIDHGRSLGAGDANLTLPRVDHRALAAARYDQRLDLLQHLRGRPTGLLLQHLPFVVVH